MDRLTNVASGSIICSYTNTPAGFLAKKTYNNGVWTSYAYDSIGRLVALIHASAAGLRHRGGHVWRSTVVWHAPIIDI